MAAPAKIDLRVGGEYPRRNVGPCETPSVTDKRVTAIIVGLASVVALVSGCGDGNESSDTTAPTVTLADASAEQYAVGRRVHTFVDESRPTPRSGESAERPDRTLKTTLYYPADGPAGDVPTSDAAPASDAGAFPLIMFAHGLGASPAGYEDLLTQWAASGYVIAAPAFPLSNSETPGGPDGSDVSNQPGDISFLVDTLVDGDGAADVGLDGLINGERIGAAGHSNGALTTLGLTANTCCRDDRIDVAIVFAGVPIVFAGGDYDMVDAPPTLLVHGTDDELLPYAESVDVFNEMDGPKGLLTLEGAGHGEWLDADDPAFDTVVGATGEFLARQLRDDAAALDRLVARDLPDGITLALAADAASSVTIPTLPELETDRAATVEPATGLRGEQIVTVTWSGFTPGGVVNIVQCAPGPLGSSEPCDLIRGKILQPDATGAGSLELEIVEGPVGTGVCDAANNHCLIAINDDSSQDPDATIRVPISFSAA